MLYVFKSHLKFEVMSVVHSVTNIHVMVIRGGMASELHVLMNKPFKDQLGPCFNTMEMYLSRSDRGFKEGCI
jgi:hypothetical protein